MKLIFSKEFKKKYKKLSVGTQKQVNKQLGFLQEDFHHPSLYAKKKEGTNEFEARVSRGYRMTYEVIDDNIYMHTVGPHDEGLGKK